MFKQLLEDIKDLDYVVQRNWEELPEGDPDHPDLDLFVANHHYAKLMEIVRKHNLQDYVDVRFPGDGYYPPEIEVMLLEDVHILMVKIPNPKSHFLSLNYHSLVHKENDPYRDKLKELFLQAYPPVRPVDTGVGYYV